MRGLGRGLALGALSGVAAALLMEAVRPRGGMAVLLDWEEVTRLARARQGEERVAAAELRRVASIHRQYAAEVRGPLLEMLGGLPEGARLPEFEALDRPRWLELNVGIMRRTMEPLTEVMRVRDSWLAGMGRAGLAQYVAVVLTVLSRRVLGQFDPQLIPTARARELREGRTERPTEQALYLVEPNVADWERQAALPGKDLRRWLILHEMTHAWQFLAHPWLRDEMEHQLRELVTLTAGLQSASGLDRVRAVAVGVPAQRQILRRMQATMSLIEGHGNLAMNLVGRRALSSFDRLQAAYRRRMGERNPFEALVWRLTGLELKLEQYRVGEQFAQAVYDRYGMEALNRAWESAEALPSGEELRDPDRWYRRVVRGTS